MNVLACLTPKSEVIFVKDDSSLLKTLQTMQKGNYSAIPIINNKGLYIGTITSGDILGCITENFDLSITSSADFPLRNVRRTRDYRAIGVHTSADGVIEAALDQNFVPVVDDEEKFIGILTRKEILRWMKERYNNTNS